MKKFLFLIVTLAYFASATGATIYIHECMGKVVDWNFQKDEGDTCHNCGMEKNDPTDCCKDDTKVLKSENNSPASVIKSLQLTDYALPVNFFIPVPFIYNTLTRVQAIEATVDKPHPPKYCILYCTFLI